MNPTRGLPLPLLLWFSFALGVYHKTAFAQNWELVRNLPLRREIELFAVHPANPNHLFVGGAGILYGSSDHGSSWTRLVNLGLGASTNRMCFEGNRIFLLTTEGVFESRNFGNDWEKTFFGSNRREQNALSLTRDPASPDAFYLGTEGGLFKSSDGGKTWTKGTGELGRSEIRELKTDFENGEVFIVSERGLYREIPRRRRLDHVYVTWKREILEEEVVEFEPDLESQTDRDQVQTLSLLADPAGQVALGTTEGVLLSDDEGTRWERVSTSGLGSLRIWDLAYSVKAASLFAAAEKGVYVYRAGEKRWKEFASGLPFGRVTRLAVSASVPEILYAAAPEGIYQIEIDLGPLRPEPKTRFSEDTRKLLTHLFRLEPSAGEVQNRAIRYANVSNWKTRRWQWGSRLRALIPSFSVGKDFSTSTSVDLDRGSTNEPDVYIVGPPDKSEGWDLDLKWDLSDLIFNSSQTSIDSREKSMVELRENILSEVTRLYYERRRAQTEFVLRPLEDPVERMNALFRIDELTAHLDALTGGFLTDRLNALYADHPQFYELWQDSSET